MVTDEHKKKMSELLVETKAYQDLDRPVILTSGELGIYYINAEKLCQDGGKFNEYGESSSDMVEHAVIMTEEKPAFKKAIDILCEEVNSILPSDGSKFAISGGQRRDWLFSGPVAVQLGLDHVSLYKQVEGQNNKIELLHPDPTPTPREVIATVIASDTISKYGLISNLNAIHIADLLTEGSSVYSANQKGWVPMLRSQGGNVKNLMTVVTRLQGGEERLKEQGVDVHSFVAIDENFLRTYSANPERAVEYFKSPKAWSENYLMQNGALALIGNFDPAGKNIERAKKFIARYSSTLNESGKMQELETEVQTKYNKSLNEIIR